MITAQKPWTVKYHIDGSAALLDREGNVFGVFTRWQDAEHIKTYEGEANQFEQKKDQLEDCIADLEGQIEALNEELKGKDKV